MPEDDISQSFQRAGETFERKTAVQRTPREPGKGWFHKAPEQMKKWFNTTSGFICGVFGGFLMVVVSAAVVGALGFIAFIAVAYFVMNINLTRCLNEYSAETGVSNPSENIQQQCRVKVGLGRSDGKDKGYWR